MRQGFVRALALGALTVVACAPVATAGAAGGSGATAPPPAVVAPNRPLTWADVAGRLRQLGRLDPPGDASASGGGPASLRAAAVPAAAPAPTITATPSTNVKSGDTITVAGTGFTAGNYAVAECSVGATTPGDCDLSGVGVFQPDSSGAFSTTMPARRTLRLPTGRLDCATVAGTCEIVTIDARSFVTLAARASLTFDPNAALPHPTIVVSPSTNLRDAQQVTVTGTGWKPNSLISVGQCFTGSQLCLSGQDYSGSIGADGKLSATVTVSIRGNDDLGRLTNCRAMPCEIDALSYDAPDYYTAAPIAFDPSRPIPPPPTITVTPSTGLHHGQAVTVSGTGFDPNTEVDVSECAPSSFGVCGDYLLGVQTDAHGGFADVGLAVSRLVTSYTDNGPSPTPFDCATSGCTVSGASYGEQLSLVASAPIAFDASVPPPALPVVTVTPHADLPYRADVTVHGTGYAPGEYVSADFCIDADLSGYCGVSYANGTADGSGVVSFTISLRRRYTFDTQRLDCVDPATTCDVEVDGQHGYERVIVPVTFDPNAPIPPQPTVTVSPDHDLGYRQTATVTGDGFAPGPVSVEECGSFDTGVTDVCPVFAELGADASGHVSGTVDILRILAFNPTGGPQVDCATATQPCVLQVGNFGDDVAVAPLQFDPNSQPPPPPPALTVTPSTGLFDGQHVTVAGRNFLPGSQVGITECKAGVTAIADGCDLSQVRVATVGADGTFSRRFVTESVLGTSDGPLDCTVHANACVLTAANAPLRQDFAAAPLSFDPPELAVTGVGVKEGTGDMTMAPVKVGLSEPDRNPITVHWVADPETASPGTDFTSMRGTLTIPAGATSAMIDTEVVADAIDEPTETFHVRVADTSGTSVVDRTGVVTIHDDDPAPSVIVHDGRRREDHDEANAEVVLSAPSGRTVIVRYVTHHMTARAGSDYVRKDSRLIFLPGETRHVVRVTLVDDHVREPTETFQVEIDSVEQATIGRGTATVTITDDD